MSTGEALASASVYADPAAPGSGDADEAVCRVCHEGSGVLYHPCLCAGSIRFVHQECLTTWLRVSRQSQSEAKCELCGSKFVFRSVYKAGVDGAPPKLSTMEFIAGLMPRVWQFTQEVARISITTTSWLFCLPLLVAYLVELSSAFVLGKNPQAVNIVVGKSVAQIMTSWWNGLLISLFIALCSISILQFAAALHNEFTRINNQQQQEQQQQQQQLEQQRQRQRAAAPQEEAGGAVFNLDQPLPDGEAVAALEPQLPLPLPRAFFEDNPAQGPAPLQALRDINVLNGVAGPAVAELTLEFWLIYAAYNAAFILAFHVVPILVGRTVLAWVGFNLAAFEPTFAAWINAELGQHKERANELHTQYFGAPLPALELTAEYLWPRAVVMCESFLGGCLLVALAFFSVAVFIVVFYRQTVTKIAEVVDAQSRALWATTRTWAVVSAFLLYDGGMLPQLLGWLIDFSTLKVFETTLASRMELCAAIPVLCTFAHWVVGFFFMLHLNVVIAELKGMVRHDLLAAHMPDLLVREIDDQALEHIAQQPLSTLLLRALVVTCIFVPGVFFVVLVPSQWGHYVTPGAAPLRLRLNEVVLDAQLPMEMLVFHILIPVALERLRHRSLVRRCLEGFLLRACRLLGLEDVLEPHVLAALGVGRAAAAGGPPADAAAGVEANAEAGAARALAARWDDEEDDDVDDDAWVTDEEDEDEDWPPIQETAHAPAHAPAPAQALAEPEPAPEQSGAPVEPPAPPAAAAAVLSQWCIEDIPRPVRCALLFCSGLAALSLASCWLVHLPLLVGKRLLASLRLTVQHDLYALSTGFCACWAVFSSAQYVARDVLRNADLPSLLRAAGKWGWAALKCSLLASVWLTLPPLLLGVLLEAVLVVPVRTGFTETPRYPLVQCWAVGLVLLKIWTRCLLVGALGENPPFRGPIQAAVNAGLLRLDLWAAVRDVVVPVTVTLLDLLVTPYFIARVLGALLTTSYGLQTFLVRHSFAAYMASQLAGHVCGALKRQLRAVYEEIRDSRYLVGTELTNQGTGTKQGFGHQGVQGAAVIAAPIEPLAVADR